MLNRSFLRAGHTPTLLSSFFYFAVSYTHLTLPTKA